MSTNLNSPKLAQSFEKPFITVIHKTYTCCKVDDGIKHPLKHFCLIIISVKNKCDPTQQNESQVVIATFKLQALKHDLYSGN